MTKFDLRKRAARLPHSDVQGENMWGIEEIEKLCSELAEAIAAECEDVEFTEGAIGYGLDVKRRCAAIARSFTRLPAPEDALVEALSRIESECEPGAHGGYLMSRDEMHAIAFDALRKWRDAKRRR